MLNRKKLKDIHNTLAPYWAIALFTLVSTGLSTIWFDWGSFWNGYILDMVGPGWSYILFRGLFTNYTDNAWRKIFSPKRTFSIFILICISIETLQYFKIYDSTYDPLDFLAYGSILIPVFIIDNHITIKYQ